MLCLLQKEDVEVSDLATGRLGKANSKQVHPNVHTGREHHTCCFYCFEILPISLVKQQSNASVFYLSIFMFLINSIYN